MPANATVEGQTVVVTLSAGDGRHQLSLSPAEALALSGELAAAMQIAIQNGATPISDEVARRQRLEIGPWSYEVAGSRDGRAAIVMQPENWLRMEFEIKASGARTMAESLVNAAEFLEGGAKTH